MKKILSIVFVLSFYCSISLAATYYISTTGNDTTGNGSSGTPWLTLKKAMATMSGGDTLIVKDGTYTGADNSITTTQYPPAGSSGAWTKIIAENTGNAIFDGQDITSPINFIPLTSAGNVYWHFEGLLFKNGLAANVQINRASYLKFITCGSVDAPATNANFYIGRDKQASYILFEGCYAWGDGRYKFEVYQSSYVVMRNCVARMDVVTNSSNPIAAFTSYSNYECEIQNCIAIDCDQPLHYNSGGGQWAGMFSVACTDMVSDNVFFKNCIGINGYLNGVTISQNTAADDNVFTNCILWNCNSYLASNNVVSERGNNDIWTNCLIGGCSTSYRLFGNGDGNRGTKLRNLLFTKNYCGSNFFSNQYDYDYNAYYLNNSTPTLSTHDTKSVNPIWSTSNTSGGLKYLPRIESGSNLSGVGESGADIGANVLTLYGSTGTLWGETGYNTDTSISMWPFPNEGLIQSKMMAYTYTDSTGTVNGTRGFCSTSTYSLDGSSMTLTKYIWEYLGNQIPVTIYGSSQTFVGSTVTVTCTVNSTYTVTGATLTFTGSATTTVGSIASYGWSCTGAVFASTSTQNTTAYFPSAGTYTVTLRAADSNNTAGTGTNTVTVTVTDPPVSVIMRGFNMRGGSVNRTYSWVLDQSQPNHNSGETASPSTNSSRFGFTMTNTASRIKVNFYGFAFTSAPSTYTAIGYLRDSYNNDFATFNVLANGSDYENSIDVTGTFTAGHTYYVVISSPANAMGFGLTNSQPSPNVGMVQRLNGTWSDVNLWAKFYVYRYE